MGYPCAPGLRLWEFDLLFKGGDVFFSCDDGVDGDVPGAIHGEDAAEAVVSVALGIGDRLVGAHGHGGHDHVGEDGCAVDWLFVGVEEGDLKFVVLEDGECRWSREDDGDVVDVLLLFDEIGGAGAGGEDQDEEGRKEAPCPGGGCVFLL